MKTVSVLTPTYNRADLLGDLYKSLCAQTNKDFEWIIIDDGSTDNTKALAQTFQADFPIIYHYKDNGGKHTALNIGFEMLDSKYTIIVDSDDTLTPDAVETIIKTWDEQTDKRVGVVSFLRIDKTGKPYGGLYPIDGEIKSLFKMHYTADKAESFRTDVLKQYRFPVVKDERFIGEGVVWSKIARKYLYAFYNKGIYVCEYLAGGLTKSGRAMRMRNPKGGMINANVQMMCPFPLKIIIKSVLLYGIYACCCDISTIKLLKKSNRPVLSFMLFPVSYAIYRYWKRKYT